MGEASHLSLHICSSEPSLSEGFCRVGPNDEGPPTLCKEVLVSPSGLSQTSGGSWTSLLVPPEDEGPAEGERGWEPLEGYEEWHIDLQQLYLGRRFAVGTYGRLYQGLYKGAEVAAKILRQPNDDEEAATLAKQFEQEVSMQAMLSHPNIVKFLGACHKPPAWCILSEYASGGNLRSFLSNQEEPLPPATVVAMALDIARGMEYLHSKGVVHRDLKSDNIVIDPTGMLKITDFGVARLAGEPVNMTAETGTYRWMAPEMINHQPYTEKVDVYSFGIVLWEIITADQPFKGMTAVQAAFAVVNKNARPPVPEKTLAVLGELMESCWQAHDDKRPSFSEIVRVLRRVGMELETNPERLPSVKSFKQRVNRYLCCGPPRTEN